MVDQKDGLAFLKINTLQWERDSKLGQGQLTEQATRNRYHISNVSACQSANAQLRMLTIIGPASLALARNQSSSQNTCPPTPSGPTLHILSAVWGETREVNQFSDKEVRVNSDITWLWFVVNQSFSCYFLGAVALREEHPGCLVWLQGLPQIYYYIFVAKWYKESIFSRKTQKYNICPINTKILDHALGAKNVCIAMLEAYAVFLKCPFYGGTLS